MRLFIALELPENVILHLENWKNSMCREYSFLKWTNTQNLHITLRFLGNVNPDSTTEQMTLLNLGRFLPVAFQLDRSGTFGRPPSVLWVGGRFPKGLDEAALLLGDIRDERGLCLGKPFIPHVTMARAKRGYSVPEVRFSKSISGEASVISLVSSTLTPSGPVYRTLFSVGL